MRKAVLAQLPPHPLLLDLGAGSGRIGWSFVAAADNYVGVDLSYGMMQAFQRRASHAALVQADGCALPFGNKTFDGVMLVQVFGGLKRWRALIDESVRVLRPGGTLMLGRTHTPDGGIDTRMKRQLDVILDEHAAGAETHNVRAQAELHLEERAVSVGGIDAAAWAAVRTPRNFLDRHAAGARFAKLPLEMRARALRQLSNWAVRQFGSLDARFPETHRFTLRTFRFEKG